MIKAIRTLPKKMKLMCAISVGLLICCVCLLGWVGQFHFQRTTALALVTQLKIDQAALASSLHKNEQSLSADEFAPPNRDRSLRLIHDLGVWSDKLGVSLTKMAISHHPTTREKQGRVQLDTGWSGSYPAAKQMLGDLMGRYESLAIERLSIQPAGANAAKQTWELTLVFYVKD